MLNKIATIEYIHHITPIPDADLIETVHILGYTSVVKKGEFKIGDLVIFVFPDTIWPNPPEEFKFLEKNKYRIRSIKLRGQLSYGLVIPIPKSWDAVTHEHIGEDVSHLLGIEKYEKPIPAALAGEVRAQFLPYSMRITDEILLQSEPKLLEELWGKRVALTLKADGSSGTYAFKDDDFRVCSRKIDLKPSDTNTFWRMAKKYDLSWVLADYKKRTGLNAAIRGEVVGPDIQKNRLKMIEHGLLIFDVLHLDTMEYLGHNELVHFVTYYELPMVPVINVIDNFSYSIRELVELASELKYECGNKAEGMVIRPVLNTYSQTLRDRLSCKVINPNYQD